MLEANHFLEKVEQCVSLRALAGSDRELANALQSMGNEFMALAD
jgi:hypothetical protein